MSITSMGRLVKRMKMGVTRVTPVLDLSPFEVCLVEPRDTISSAEDNGWLLWVKRL